MKAFTSFDQLLEVAREQKPKTGFAAVVSNPPYQTSTGDEEDTANQTVVNVFQYFYFVSLDISEKTSMIFPGGRWMQKSLSASAFANEMIATVNSVDWYPNGDEVGVTKLFETARIHDGLSIVYSDKNLSDQITLNGMKVDRPKEDEILPLQKEYAPIVVKAKNLKFDSVAKNRTPIGLFGFSSNFTMVSPDLVTPIESKHSYENPIKALMGNEVPGTGKSVREYWIDESSVTWTTKRKEVFSSWKVVASQGHIAKFPSGVKYRVVPPGYILGWVYVVVGSFQSEYEAENYKKYLSSKVSRLLADSSRGGKTLSWCVFVPDLKDYTDSNPHIDWSQPLDPQLYKLLNLTPTEIKIVEAS